MAKPNKHRLCKNCGEYYFQFTKNEKRKYCPNCRENPLIRLVKKMKKYPVEEIYYKKVSGITMRKLMKEYNITESNYKDIIYLIRKNNVDKEDNFNPYVIYNDINGKLSKSNYLKEINKVVDKKIKIMYSKVKSRLKKKYRDRKMRGQMIIIN